MTQKVSIRGPEAGLRGRELEHILAQALEKRTHGLDVSRWVRCSSRAGEGEAVEAAAATGEAATVETGFTPGGSSEGP